MRLKKIYIVLAINILNLLMLLLALNLALYIFYKLKDNFLELGHKGKEENFTNDSRPFVQGDLNNYIGDFFDFRAFENADPSETIEMLKEANKLTRLGFNYVELGAYAEPVFSGKHLNILVDSMGFTYRKTVHPPNSNDLPVK
jgi:hypothetical protein